MGKAAHSTAASSSTAQKKQLQIPAVEGAAPGLPLADSEGPMPRRMLLGCAVRYILAAGDRTPETEQALKALEKEIAAYEETKSVKPRQMSGTNYPYFALAESMDT